MEAGGRQMITIFALANTSNKTYEYLCDLKGRVKSALPVGTKAKIIFPSAIHSDFYLLRDLKRISEVDKVIILEDDHTDLYTDILEYFYHNMKEGE